VDLGGLRWRKSSSSSGSDEETNCVEVAMVAPSAWRKSSRNSGQGDAEKENCVEVAMVGTAIHTAGDNAVTPVLTAIRDSKNPGPALAFSQDAWSGLVRRLVG
jgi:hypothetical protein